MYCGLDGVLECRVTVNLSEVPVFINYLRKTRRSPESSGTLWKGSVSNPARNAAPQTGRPTVATVRARPSWRATHQPKNSQTQFGVSHVRRTHSLDHQARRRCQERHRPDHRPL